MGGSIKHNAFVSLFYKTWSFFSSSYKKNVLSSLLLPSSVHILNFSSLTNSDMDSYPYTQTNSKFIDLLHSQQNIFGLSEDSFRLSSPHVPLSGTKPSEETAAERRERRKWTPIDDVVLISSWLNTSKDPVVGNEQKSRAFWKMIAVYFAASPKVAGCEHREAAHCKQRWHKINDLVNKFCGAYEAASREKSSGQNENDVLKLAHEIFFNNHKKKIQP